MNKKKDKSAHKTFGPSTRLKIDLKNLPSSKQNSTRKKGVVSELKSAPGRSNNIPHMNTRSGKKG